MHFFSGKLILPVVKTIITDNKAKSGPLLTAFLTFLDVVVAQSTAILELFAGENQTLLIWRDSLLILDLGLDILDSVWRFDLEGNGLTRQGFDENLHGGEVKRLLLAAITNQKEVEVEAAAVARGQSTAVYS